MAIRELTKSVISFSWAMSLFPLQQTLNILQPAKAARSFDEVTGATRGEFSQTFEAAFKAGDDLQRGLVDLSFGVLTLQAFNPSTWIRAASDLTQRTARAAADAAQRTTHATCGAAGESGRATYDATERAAHATADAARQAAGEGTGRGGR